MEWWRDSHEHIRDTHISLSLVARLLFGIHHLDGERLVVR
jgi:hypothetical protein